MSPALREGFPVFRRRAMFGVFVLGLLVGAAVVWIAKDGAKSRAAAPGPDMMGTITLSRTPLGGPDEPAPRGGKFVPYLVTYDGSRQVRGEQPAGPVWLFRLADERIVIHAVRVAD